MSQSLAPPAAPPPEPLPRNVKVLGLASLLNDTASEMIYPLVAIHSPDLGARSRDGPGASEEDVAIPGRGR